MNVSAAIVHHPSRDVSLNGMLDRLSGLDVTICVDEGQGPIENTRGAWASFSPRAAWHLVMEDDLLLSESFARTLKAALESVPVPGGAVSLFGISRRYADAFNAGYAWYLDNGTNWAQALCVPTRWLPAFLEWERERVAPEHRWFCQRLTAYCQHVLLPVQYTLPMLVDHLGAASSLVGNPTLAGGTHPRTAACFVERPPLDPEYWQGRVVARKNHAKLDAAALH